MTQQTQTNGNSILVQGRIIWTSGNLFEGKKKVDDRTKQVIMDQNGQPVIEYGFGLAVPKTHNGQFTEEFTKLWNAMQTEARSMFPNGQVPSSFSMKFKDGDTDVDLQGVPYSQREGYANHFVIACTTRIPMKFFRFEQGNNILVNDGFKCGDYVKVQLNIKAHPAIGQGKAGLYLNPSAVQMIQPGKEIINTPSGDQLFGTSAPTYVGEMVAPVNAPMPGYGVPAAAPAMPGYPSQVNPTVTPNYPGAQQAPAMPAYNQPPQAPAAQPHYNVLPPQHQPQQAPAMPAYNQPPQAPAYPSNPGMPAMPGYPR